MTPLLSLNSTRTVAVVFKIEVILTGEHLLKQNDILPVYRGSNNAFQVQWVPCYSVTCRFVFNICNWNLSWWFRQSNRREKKIDMIIYFDYIHLLVYTLESKNRKGRETAREWLQVFLTSPVPNCDGSGCEGRGVIQWHRALAILDEAKSGRQFEAVLGNNTPRRIKTQFTPEVNRVTTCY